MLDDACHGGVASQWAKWAFQRYDDFPSEWDQLQASVPTELCPAPLHHTLDPLILPPALHAIPDHISPPDPL